MDKTQIVTAIIPYMHPFRPAIEKFWIGEASIDRVVSGLRKGLKTSRQRRSLYSNEVLVVITHGGDWSQLGAGRRLPFPSSIAMSDKITGTERDVVKLLSELPQSYFQAMSTGGDASSHESSTNTGAKWEQEQEKARGNNAQRELAVIAALKTLQTHLPNLTPAERSRVRQELPFASPEWLEGLAIMMADGSGTSSISEKSMNQSFYEGQAHGEQPGPNRLIRSSVTLQVPVTRHVESLNEMADHVIETATDTRLQCRVPVHPGVGASLGLGKEEAAADEWGVHGKSCPSNAHKQRAPLSSPRWNVTAEQRYTLEAFFEQAPLPSRAARQLLATKMGVSPQQIKVWFRNARQRKRQGLGCTEVASLGPHVGTLQPVARVAGSPYNNTYGVYAMSCL